MPFTFLAHQAAVLPLRLAVPSRVSGTALVLGSMAPDVEYIIRTYPSGTLGHSWPGQVAFCLPVTLVLYWLVTRVVAPAAAANRPAGAPPSRPGIRDYALLAASRARATPWTVVAFSALVGSASHVVLDRAEAAVVRAVATGTSPSAGGAVVVQVLISVALAVAAAWMLRSIARRGARRSDPGTHGWRAFWPAVAAIALAGAAAGAVLRRPGFFLDAPATWVHIWLATVAGGFVGLVAVSALWFAAHRED